MATYKVIQDIEAEDKLVGPLTLRQFIYAAIAAICGYISFLGITKGAYFLLIVSMPPMLVAGFFAFPWKGDQPTEIWALARLRFAIKPRRRIWDQTGIKDYVTITVPKKIEINYTNGLNQTEVTSRLHTLADVIDSRGWATKNAAYSAYGQPALVDPNSDRLVAAETATQAVSNDNITASDDMLDDQSSVAHQFDSMLNKSGDDRRKRVLQEMSAAQNVAPNAHGSSLPSPVMPMQQPQAAPQSQSAQPQPAWFMNDSAGLSTPPVQIVAPGTAEDEVPAAAAAEPTAEEKALAAQFKEQNQAAQQISYGHLHVVQPLSATAQPASTAPTQAIIDYTNSKDAEDAARQKELANIARKRAEAAVTHQPDPAIINLANNDDEDIATLARRANKEIRKSPDEVEIRLH